MILQKIFTKRWPDANAFGGRFERYVQMQFQIEIVQHLTSNKWIEGDASGYDRELALYPQDLISYIRTTQPQAYEKMQKREGIKTDEVLCKHVAKEMDKHSSLHFLRNDLKYIGSKFKLCQFKPELHNPDTQAKYDANILRVVQEVTTKSGHERIDLVLFLNGIPIATMELKDRLHSKRARCHQPIQV